MPPPVLPSMPLSSSADERRLGRLFRALDPQSRETLLAFAEFLATGREPSRVVDQAPQQPLPEPRPADESVVAAIRRLRRVYPMLAGASLLNEASSLMAAHVMHGRPAQEVIDELEQLFASRYDEYRERLG
jgi:hypothetical protein